MSQTSDDEPIFRDAVRGLIRGDFSRLEPLFLETAGAPPRMIAWHGAGRFGDEPHALAEALTAASFLGRVDVAEYLLAHGVDSSGGNGTGLNALHWAANRGQLDAVQLLIRRGAPLETRSMHGGTVLGTAVWSAINEPRPQHLAIIELLLEAGARVQDAGYPTTREQIDVLLRRYGAS
jgi:hypothetical protein